MRKDRDGVVEGFESDAVRDGEQVEVLEDRTGVMRLLDSTTNMLII